MSCGTMLCALAPLPQSERLDPGLGGSEERKKGQTHRHTYRLGCVRSDGVEPVSASSSNLSVVTTHSTGTGVG